MPSSKWIVLKYGGTSVASAEGWTAVEVSVRALMSGGARVMVVCSAVAKVSDTIEAAIDRAAGGQLGHEVQDLRAIHANLSTELGIRLPTSVVALLDRLAEELPRLVAPVPPRVRARLMGLGEQLSTRLGEAWLQSRGLDVRWADAA